MDTTFYSTTAVKSMIDDERDETEQREKTRQYATRQLEGFQPLFNGGSED